VSALACPASLKGVLSAFAAAKALGDGLRGVGVEVVELPVADGGEGTAEVLAAALGGTWHEAEVADPLGRPVRGRWLLLPDERGVVEAAAAVGLPLLEPHELDPLRASSYGFGELIAAALAGGARELLLCIGGVATVDGGAGMLEALGGSCDTVSPSPFTVRARVACDVATRLGDAARLFGPQKGASPEDVRELERRLAGMEALRPYAELPGSGAAGGLGAALAALGADLVPGAELVLEIIGFRRRLAGVELAVTGEGPGRPHDRRGQGARRRGADLPRGRRALRRLRRARARAARRRGDGAALGRPGAR
jgi:glycerate 2-kinase